jgi:hypothetical protein
MSESEPKTPGESVEKSTPTVSALRRLWSNTDPISKWVQVVALVVAAYWTYTTFNLGEAPALKPNALVLGTLTSEDIEGGAGCYVEFQVSVENIGKTAFDVRKVWLRAWRTEIPKPALNESDKVPHDALQYVDIDGLQNSTPIVDKVIDKGNLVAHYLPQNETGQTFTWTLNRAPSQFLYLFRADAVIGDDSLDAPHNYGPQWRDDLCVLRPQPKNTK